jgi:hypothetical protein
MAARATICDTMDDGEPTNNQHVELLLPRQINGDMLYINDYHQKKETMACKRVYGGDVTSKDWREPCAKKSCWSTMLRWLHRNENNAGKSDNEKIRRPIKVVIKLYEHERKRVAPPKKESRAVCMPLPNYHRPKEAPLTHATMTRPYCYFDNRKRHMQPLENGVFAARSFKIVVHAISMPITCVS